MRRRKEKPAISKATAVAEKNKEEDDEDEESGGFFSCYLLTSACPRYKGHTYIGFTVNPKRRIRQHNGEIRCGAWRTKRKRPWEMVLCIYGFPTNVSALQFEWAWQHPNESLAVRSAAATFKSLSGVANKVKLAYTMLTLPAWCSLNITVNYFSTKYMKNAAGSPSLPEHMKVRVSPINELPCYSEGDQGVLENADDWEFNRELEEICSFQVYGWTKEVPNEIPQKLMDYQTGGKDGTPNESHGCDEELEDNEQEPPSRCTSCNDVDMSYDLRGCNEELEPPLCAPSSITLGMSRTEIIIEDGVEDQLEGSGMNLQQQQHPSSRKNSTSGIIATEISKVSRCNNVFPPAEYEFQEELEDDEREPPSCAPSSATVGMSRAEIIIEDGEEDRLEGSGMNLQQQPGCSRKDSTSGIATEMSKVSRCSNLFSSVEYEVIDVSTPSPGCRTSSHRFKRRITSGNSEIIDLTKSPTFIQL